MSLRWRSLSLAGLFLGFGLGFGALGQARAAGPAPADLALQPCWLKGVEHRALCGVLRRPLDPARPSGVQVDIHVAVLPAVARNRKPDPVFFFAGGPGQSAIELAGTVSQLLARFRNRRDLVLIDQRGTGLSAPLRCDDESPSQPLRDSSDPGRQAASMRACRLQLQALPYGDLRQFTTLIAIADAEAVRLALGLGPVNLIGGSYGTRAVLEYLRQYPASVRRAVLDGVAPADMALPMSFSTDAQSAFDALLQDCDREAACARQYPALRRQWQALLDGLPREVEVRHPLTSQPERLVLRRDMLTGLLRLPLYAPAVASVLPMAIDAAARGEYSPLVGLVAALQPARGLGLAAGMHFSVVCAEDMPRLAQSRDAPGADFGNAVLDTYREVCAGWPQAALPPAYYTLPPTPAGTLLLSGAIDPVTPPRHAARVAAALGPQAVHLVLPQTGHGTLAAVACLRDAVFRFVDTESQPEALAQVRRDADCAARLPRPPALLQLAPAAPAPLVAPS